MQKRIVILGAGESGTGAALLAQKQGYEVFVSDLGAIDPLYKEQLEAKGIGYEEKQHTKDQILNAAEIIKSPGIPDDTELIRLALEKEIPVISEIEFAARYTDAKLIGITGTNGKTTTTLLTYHILKENGYHVGLAGNVGFSFAKQVCETDYDVYVLELSSFQLDGMFNTRLEAGVLLNITTDHLNRYGNDMNNYIRSKFGITRNMDSRCSFIFNADDPNIVNQMHLKNGSPKPVTISVYGENAADATYRDGNLTFSNGEGTFKVDVDDLPLRGPHNYLNMMAAVEASSHLGLDFDKAVNAVKTFKNAPHRLELVAEVDGVKYFNDSKATNVDAVKYALQSFSEPIVWIVGGVDKGNDYKEIEALVKDKVKALVAMGKDNKKILAFFKGKINKIVDTDNLKDAVKRSSELAKDGDVVLLSPACASFDLFRNYEDRGDQFRNEVKKNIEKSDKNMMLTL